MKRLILILSVVTMSSSAQELTVGPRLGANFSTFKGAENSSSLTGFTGGAFFAYKFVDFFGVSVDALYSGEGGRYVAGINNFNVEFKSRLNYLRLPVLANAFFGPADASIRPKVVFGPVIGFLMSVESEVDVAGFSLGLGMDKSDFTSMDFGAAAGAGVDFNITERMSLSLEGRYYFGATDIFEVDLPVFDEVKNNSVSVLLGLGFVIGK